ncbi:winged helix-turn-helix transcriptional regulator [Pedobacter sp. MR2016-24]|uniref:winged helix-turn-helix transcriptional regulator n=1 Tax=Pedobacter sp. MR2016-24 TaxID=2994466 RepID=UPI0022472501|nr:helix-turn-helix domain-containing protein [Pedobacter sp. MR2016-24]MCX2486143.1 helix-turn-helix domain-containing protein [Pedobacter sp. MR2016-24]
MVDNQIDKSKKKEPVNYNELCPVRNVLDRFGDKWSILVIVVLGTAGKLRFNELQKEIGDISQKMLTITLRKLEADDLVMRKIYPVIPPMVEYTITDRGTTLLPLIQNLTDWAQLNMPGINSSREKFKRKNTMED